MLKIAKKHINPKATPPTMESLHNDPMSLEAWFSGRKNKRNKLSSLRDRKRLIDTEADLERALTDLEKELVDALIGFDLGIDKRIIDETVKTVRGFDSWMGTRFKKRPPTEFKTLLRHDAYVSGNLNSVLMSVPLPIRRSDGFRPDDIVYQSQDLVIYVDQDSDGNLSLTPEELWRFDRHNIKSRSRDRAVEEVREDLRAYLLDLWKDAGEQGSWVDDRGHVNYEFDEIMNIEEPADAVFKYKEVFAEYPDGGGNSTFLVEHRDELVCIDIDHELADIVVY